MTDSTGRREYLLAALRRFGGPVTTKRALTIYAKSGWTTVGRNTARRDLRDLARRAYLVPAEHCGRRFYQLSRNPSPGHPTARGSRKAVLEAIQTEGGEWTTSRIRHTWHQLIGTHVLRFTARRYLAALHRDGHLDRHGDGTPRRFYTVRKDNA
jgi:hypothetical protein